MTSARLLRVTGVVQGVGFRPFVHRLAVRHSLGGWVRNVAGTVEIFVEGDDAELGMFERSLTADAPPAAQIEHVRGAPAMPIGRRDFRITASSDAWGHRPVSADLALCADCEAELFDPANRRYEHPFISCTNCGPRYTIIRSLPYDRERTSMAGFPLCAACQAEYDAIADRRHHAETIACHECGPRVWTAGIDGEERAEGNAAIREAAARLQACDIVAVRGLGGFHLACDATDDAAVRRLRERKHREAKPFAVMVRTLEDARRWCDVTDDEARLLSGPERPIVLVRQSKRDGIAAAVSPGLSRLGLMLAYTPLHHLLLKAADRPLVMTSGNLTDEPIAIDNAEALTRLRGIADLFVMHDREILSRIDDSVARVVDGAPLLLRRARGYAPRATRLPVESPRPLVAVGPHLKNTFTLVDGDLGHVSPHIGDLESVEALSHFNDVLARYKNLFRTEPEVAVRDMHPGYLSTRVAAELGLPRTIAVQHHHAHVAAVLAEHRLSQTVVGLAFDGTGYGDDGNIWGAETLIADLTGYRRAAGLRYAPLPGGDLAVREPWRAALGYLSLEPNAATAIAPAFADVTDFEQHMARRQIEQRLNAPLASSMGRLFDAAAAVLGVRSRSEYEGQAAMQLEALAGDTIAPPLPFPVVEANGFLTLDPVPLLAALGERRRRGDDASVLAASFHESVAKTASDVAIAVASTAGIGTVVLSGGSFQNARLLSCVRRLVEASGLQVLVPRRFGPGDGAISLGQALVAAAMLAAGR